MSIIQSDFSLLEFNTFHVAAICKFFTKIQSIMDIQDLLEKKEFRYRKSLVLGGGSNILFANNFSGMVLKNEIKGITIIEETDDFVYLKVGSGENWHDFVTYCLDNNFYGTENLSLIPGTVGAAPIQNIGAYGAEVKDIIENVQGINLKSKQTKILSNEECKFSYRNSIFKQKAFRYFFITYITFRLQKKMVLNIRYPSLKQEIEKMKIPPKEITPHSISKIIIKIRQSKLPDPKQIGNAGSFFHNPVVSEKLLQKLQKQHPKMPYFSYKKNLYKIPAAWLIKETGLQTQKHRGENGFYGIYPKHFLVLVNYDNATGKEILQLSQKIQTLVRKKYGILLKKEIKVI